MSLKKCHFLFHKNIRKYLILAWVCSSIIWAQNIHAQSAQAIKSKQQQIKQELKVLNEKLRTTQHKSKNIEADLKILEKKISLSETFLDYTCQMIDGLDEEIIRGQEAIDSLIIDDDNLYSQYKIAFNQAIKIQMAVEPFGQLLSYSSINDRHIQTVTLSQIQNKLMVKMDSNAVQIRRLESAMDTLNAQRIEKDSLQITESNGRKELVRDQIKIQKIRKKSSLKTEELEATIKKKSEEKVRLQKQLNKIIKETLRLAALRKSNAKKKLKSKKRAPIKVKSLLWPVSEKIILDKFGRHRHPRLKQVMVQNNGIDIKASEGEAVKSISSGQVISVTQIPGYQKAIIVSYGTYYIVYSGLGDTVIKLDASIKKDQILGYIAAPDGTSKARLHLEIWHGKKAINPMEFLK